MKSCHEMRPIDQGMGSELAAADPKWGVATRVVAETHLVAATYSTTVVTETIIGLWRPMPCGAGTSSYQLTSAIICLNFNDNFLGKV